MVSIFPYEFQMNTFTLSTIAKISTKNTDSALAKGFDLIHIEPAFQASSPKTSMARSATTGPFFLPAQTAHSGRFS